MHKLRDMYFYFNWESSYLVGDNFERGNAEVSVHSEKIRIGWLNKNW